MKAILGTMTFSDQVELDVASEMVRTFVHAGYQEMDSAYVYCGGDTELMLGQLNRLGVLEKCDIATKANPKEGGLSMQSVNQQLTTSLHRMELESVDLFYLHQPDLDTPIEDTLEALNELYIAGRFKRFGLSNYAAWQVAEIAGICTQRGYMMPTVYQGMYNAITRDVERELFKCLQYYNIAFYVYNPLAGGMLSGKHQDISQAPPEGRFSDNVEYQNRYWKDVCFQAVKAFSIECEKYNISPASAALRWLANHSELSNAKGDAIILGASSMHHFEQNLNALKEGPLPSTIIEVLDQGWEAARPHCIKYFRP